jgi:hypothetical protein
MNTTSRIDSIAALLGLALMTAFPPGWAQQPATPSPQTPPATSVVEPDAVAALNRMGAYLRTLNAFTVKSETTIDEVTDDGMKLQFGGTVTMQVKRPNGLRAEVDSDRKHRQLIYDGKTLTLYGERIGYYATAPAPATLKELGEALNQKYGIRLPLADLFYWGTDEKAMADIKEAAIIGPAKCGNATCDHVAVRQEGVDWQVWIEQGKTPLPRKLVITTLSEPSQPQYIAVMQWNVAPKFQPTTFEFKPPMSAHKIPLASADAAPASK